MLSKKANQMHSYIRHIATYFLIFNNEDNVATLEWCNNRVTEPFILIRILAGTRGYNNA